MRIKIMIIFIIFAALLLSVSPALAAPQSEIRGHGKAQLNSDLVSVSQVSINAWLDDDGQAHGMIHWVGAVPPGVLPKTGQAAPWLIEVTGIIFNGNSARVCGVVVQSVFPADIGVEVCFNVTDNGATGARDRIDSVPLEAGNFIIR